MLDLMRNTKTKMDMLIQAIICLFLITKEDATTIVMHCPALFISDAGNDVSCDVDTEDVRRGNCVSFPMTLTFELSRPGNDSVSPLCSVLYDTHQCHSANAPTEDTKCGCTKISGNIKTFAFKYVGNKAEDVGAQLLCTACAEAGEKKLTADPGSCGQLAFTNQTAAALSSTTELSAQETIERHIMKILIIACVASMLAALIAVFVGIKLWRRGRTPDDRTTPPADHVAMTGAEAADVHAAQKERGKGKKETRGADAQTKPGEPSKIAVGMVSSDAQNVTSADANAAKTDANAAKTDANAGRTETLNADGQTKHREPSAAGILLYFTQESISCESNADIKERQDASGQTKPGEPSKKTVDTQSTANESIMSGDFQADKTKSQDVHAQTKLEGPSDSSTEKVSSVDLSFTSGSAVER